jgi:hypothetical protein
VSDRYAGRAFPRDQLSVCASSQRSQSQMRLSRFSLTAHRGHRCLVTLGANRTIASQLCHSPRAPIESSPIRPGRPPSLPRPSRSQRIRSQMCCLVRPRVMKAAAARGWPTAHPAPMLAFCSRRVSRATTRRCPSPFRGGALQLELGRAELGPDRSRLLGLSMEAISLPAPTPIASPVPSRWCQALGRVAPAQYATTRASAPIIRVAHGSPRPRATQYDGRSTRVSTRRATGVEPARLRPSPSAQWRPRALHTSAVP